LKKNDASLLDVKSQRYVAITLEAAKRMGNLIEYILSYSRICSSETLKTTLSLKQLLQESLGEAGQDT
jgi:signal transduction histidine kinase